MSTDKEDKSKIKIENLEYDHEYILEVLEIYKKLVLVIKSEKLSEDLNDIFPFIGIAEHPEFKQQLDKILSLLFLSLLETWKDLTKKEKNDVTRRLDDPTSGNDFSLNSRDEWKLHVIALGAISNPELGSGKIAFKHYLESIRQLENKIGEIIFISAIKELDGEHKDNYLAYFFSRLMSYEFKYALRDNLELAMQDERNLQTDESLNLQKMLKTEDQYAIGRYCNTFDFIFENFINPIFLAVEKSLNIPRNIYLDWKSNFNPMYCPNHLKLKTLEKIFNQDPILNILSLWIANINIRLRNSLIHENYYIKNHVIYYYYRENGLIQFSDIEVKKLKEINAGNFMKLFVIPVVIALKIIEDEKLLDKLSDSV